MTRRAGPIVVGLWLLALGLLIGLVLRADYSADMSVFLPGSPTPEQALLVDQLREGAVSRLILVAIGGGGGIERAELSRAMAAALRGQSQFESVQNGAKERLADDRQWLFDHRYVLSPAVNSERFSNPGLRAALQDTLDWLASPAGMLIEPLVPRDPTGELIRILEPLEAGAQPRREDGVWVSRDGQEALMLVLTRASGADIDAQADAMARIRNAFEAAVQSLPGTGEHRLEMTGPGVFAVESRATIKGEVTRIALLASALVAALLLLVLRSLTLLLLGLLPVVTGALAGIAAVSLGFGVVHGLTIGFGATLIGEAVDYAIYLFVQGGGPADGDAASPAIPFWPTIRLGLLTSVCGFGVMLFSDFPGLAQLGLYSTAGLIAAVLVTRLVLPVLLPAGVERRDFSALGGRLAVVTRSLARLHWLIPVLCLAAILVVWQHRDRLWNDSLLALSPISPAAQALDSRLRGEMGAPDTSYLIVVDAPDREGALR
ncbi:MAG: MMPL family transporter, partial [Chromatiaceae bacterium]